LAGRYDLIAISLDDALTSAVMTEPHVLARAGECSLEVEEPDIVIYRIRGVVEGPHLRALREAEGIWNVGKPYLLVLVDISNQKTSTMDARKASTEKALGTKIRAIAIYGGNHYLKILAELSMRALRLLVREEVTTRLFDSETSARAWLDTQRPLLAQKAASTHPTD
jgi:hypothetical protein